MERSVRPDLLALILIGTLAVPIAARAEEEVRFVDLLSANSARVALTDDLQLFAGLMPAEPLAEEELDRYYGRGVNWFHLRLFGWEILWWHSVTKPDAVKAALARGERPGPILTTALRFHRGNLRRVLDARVSDAIRGVRGDRLHQPTAPVTAAAVRSHEVIDVGVFGAPVR